MKVFEIWAEGYAVNEGRASASLLGVASGETFEEACNNFAKENKDFEAYFNPISLTYWGCSLYDNEWDARKSFG